MQRYSSCSVPFVCLRHGKQHLDMTLGVGALVLQLRYQSRENLYLTKGCGCSSCAIRVVKIVPRCGRKPVRKHLKQGCQEQAPEHQILQGPPAATRHAEEIMLGIRHHL